MLTRFKVNGFKNLVNVDVRFGPFTCIAGLNGVGKSNLFDGIRFLSAVANRSLLEAALTVRGEDTKAGDVRSIFHKYGDEHVTAMDFEAEMIVPKTAVDDLGQEAKATATHLKYRLKIGIRKNLLQGGSDFLEVLEEELTHFNLGDSKKNLFFVDKNKLDWWESVVISSRRATEFISTEIGTDLGESPARICVHLDRGTGGRVRRFSNLPRTVLSVADATETPTMLCAKREMESWRLLQLEPSALRKPDSFNAPVHIESDGSHLPATLYHLANHGSEKLGLDSDAIYQNISNRVAEIVEEIRAIWVEKDEKRERFTLFARFADGNRFPARSLSDGTLRFLALSVLDFDLDPFAAGLLCLEEPENGIHPGRIDAMINLLRNIAVDIGEPVDETNPLRQVIVNTHSPVVVADIPDEALLYADDQNLSARLEFTEGALDVDTYALRFSCLRNTWREKANPSCEVLSKGKVLIYLHPIPPPDKLYSFLDSTQELKVRERSDYYSVTQTSLFENKE